MRLGVSTGFRGSAVVLKHREFIEGCLPREPCHGHCPHLLKSDSLSAFLTFRKCLTLEQRDFMRKTMSGVDHPVNSAVRYGRARLVSSPRHCGRFYQKHPIAIVLHSPYPIVELDAQWCQKG